MEISMTNVSTKFHANIGGAIVRINMITERPNGGEPFVAIDFVDGDGCRLCVYLDLGQARDLINRLADAMPPEVDHA